MGKRKKYSPLHNAVEHEAGAVLPGLHLPSSQLCIGLDSKAIWAAKTA